MAKDNTMLFALLGVGALYFFTRPKAATTVPGATLVPGANQQGLAMQTAPQSLLSSGTTALQQIINKITGQPTPQPNNVLQIADPAAQDIQQLNFAPAPGSSSDPLQVTPFQIPLPALDPLPPPQLAEVSPVNNNDSLYQMFKNGDYTDNSPSDGSQQYFYTA